MSRKPRNCMNTSFFHVMVQGINKAYIYNKPEDIKHYIKIMYELINDYNMKIIAYCIMNNHVHILINTPKLEELSNYMQRLNCKYGKYYNKKYNRVGYVFRDRFKTEGIYSEEHLLNCIKYIYDNPVKAGMCRKAEEYPYSNYKPIQKHIEDKYIFIDVDEDKEEEYKKFIIDFLNKNKIELVDIRKNKDKLKNLIETLNSRYKISFRKISEEINIPRETLRRIYNK